MEISQLTLKLIILLIPGGLGAIILERLTVHKPWTSFRFILNSIIIGFCSYGILQILSFWFNTKGNTSLVIWNSLDEKAPIPYNEVMFAILIGIALGLLITMADNAKWLNKLARKYKISYKYGDENLYSHFLYAKDTQFVYVRHMKHKFTYAGCVQSYSENEELREIVLSKVKVYSYQESELLYETDKVYLSFLKDDVIIEHAKVHVKESSVEQESTNTQNAS